MYNAVLRTLAAIVAFMAVVQLQGWGLPGVWWGFVFFFACRALQSVPRMLKIVRQDLQEEAQQLKMA